MNYLFGFVLHPASRPHDKQNSGNNFDTSKFKSEFWNNFSQIWSQKAELIITSTKILFFLFLTSFFANLKISHLRFARVFFHFELFINLLWIPAKFTLNLFGCFFDVLIGLMQNGGFVRNDIFEETLKQKLKNSKFL